MPSSSVVGWKGYDVMARNRVPAALSERLGPEATDGLLELVDSTRAEWTEHVLTLAETRFELRLTLAETRFERRLTQEISAFRVEIARELHESLAAIRQEFTRELATVRVELIRWSFVFWISQVAVTVGIIAFMLRDLTP